MRKLPQIKYFSPLGLLALTACGGENSTISTLLSGKVIKGPLNNALVGLDYDGDGVVDSATVRTDANGGYSISTTQTTYTVIAVTDESTIDTSSGAVLSGVTLKAPESATVVTPTTTLMKEGNLTVEQVASVLGLPDGVDPLTFNPYADDVSASDALAVEKASQQIMSVVNAFASTAEGAGASEAAAYTAAMNSIVEVVKTKAAASDTLDLSNTADLALIKAEAITQVASIEGVTSETTTAFDALADNTATAVENVNTEIAKASDLTSDESKSIFSTTQVLADQVKAAAEAEVETSGTGSIDFIDSASVVTSAANAMPSAINLSLSSISEGAESLVIGELSTVDSDQPDNVAFQYEIAEIAGTDYASFSINQSTGELSLKAQPDYETKSTYSVTILSTDSGGKTLSETFTVTITDVNEAPTVANAIPDQTIAEDSALSFQFNSDVFADVDIDDSLTYTATLSDGSALPTWLTFDAATRTFIGTPLNENVGAINVKVTATDIGNESITDMFKITTTNTSDAIIEYSLNVLPLIATQYTPEGIAQQIGRDIPALEEKVSSFYNDPTTGILELIDSLDSETFGEDSSDYRVSSEGVFIQNTEGYVLSFEFSNFSPSSLEEVIALEESFSNTGDIKSLDIAGGFERIALTDPYGDAMIELSHGLDGISWRNLEADSGEIDTFVIEGSFNNQIEDFLDVLSGLAELEETGIGDLESIIGTNVSINGIVAKSDEDEVFSARLSTSDIGEELTEISILGAYDLHKITLGTSGFNDFTNGLLSAVADIEGLVDVFGSYISMDINFANGDYFYQDTEWDGSFQYSIVSGVLEVSSDNAIGGMDASFIDIPEFSSADTVTYYSGGMSVAKEFYDKRLTNFEAVNNFIAGDDDAQQLFGLNLAYEYAGSEVFALNFNEIDWNKLEALENPLSFSNDYTLIASVGDNNENITTILNEFDTAAINLIGVEKDEFVKIFEDNNSNLDLALEIYTEAYHIEDEPTIISDIA